MEKKFQHKKTGEIATYKDGILKSSGFCVEIGVEPSSEFWEEVKEKIKNPILFVTEDKVNVYPKTIVYGVHIKKYEYNKYCWREESHFDARTSFTENVKYFSTEEKAEEYIVLNKPVLSISDVEKWYRDPKSSPLYKNLINGLKEIVKVRL